MAPEGTTEEKFARERHVWIEERVSIMLEGDKSLSEAKAYYLARRFWSQMKGEEK